MLVVCFGPNKLFCNIRFSLAGFFLPPQKKRQKNKHFYYAHFKKIFLPQCLTTSGTATATVTAAVQTASAATFTVSAATTAVAVTDAAAGTAAAASAGVTGTKSTCLLSLEPFLCLSLFVKTAHPENIKVKLNINSAEFPNSTRTVYILLCAPRTKPLKHPSRVRLWESWSPLQTASGLVV